jgi:hypothetical protein
LESEAESEVGELEAGGGRRLGWRIRGRVVGRLRKERIERWGMRQMGRVRN